jgi:hypothetical protein
MAFICADLGPPVGLSIHYYFEYAEPPPAPENQLQIGTHVARLIAMHVSLFVSTFVVFHDRHGTCRPRADNA